MSIRNDILLKIRAALGGSPLGVLNMSNRNKILADTVQAAGGTVRNASNLNMLLEDLYNALSADSGTITITGSGFGVAPNILGWNTVDNQGNVYDLLADGEIAPTTAQDASAPYLENNGTKMLLDSVDTYGSRARVFKSIGDAYQGKPKLASLPTQGNTIVYQQFKMKQDFNAFDADADKFFRVWDDDAGVNLRISYSNHQLFVQDVLAGTQLALSHQGVAPANRWNTFELLVDTENNHIRSKAFNLIVDDVTDPIIKVVNPLANGVIASLWGYDDGNNQSVGKLFNYTDHYVADSDSRVEIHSAADWGKSLTREIQIPTSWTDGEVQFEVDGQLIDKNNFWASVIVDEIAVSTIQIGNPTSVEQNILRLKINSTTLRQDAITLNPKWVAATKTSTVKWKMLLESSVQTTFRVAGINGGTSTKLYYTPSTKQWEVRGNYETSAVGTSTLPNLADGTVKDCEARLTAAGVDIYVDGVLDISISQPLNEFSPNLFGGVDNAQVGSAYIWDIELIDGVNDVRWEVENFVASTQASAIAMTNTVGAWDYIPGEEY